MVDSVPAGEVHSSLENLRAAAYKNGWTHPRLPLYFTEGTGRRDPLDEAGLQGMSGRFSSRAPCMIRRCVRVIASRRSRSSCGLASWMVPKERSSRPSHRKPDSPAIAGHCSEGRAAASPGTPRGGRPRSCRRPRSGMHPARLPDRGASGASVRSTATTRAPIEAGTRSKCPSA